MRSMNETSKNQNPVIPGQHGVSASPFCLRQNRQDNFGNLDNAELKILVSLTINKLHDRGKIF